MPPTPRTPRRTDSSKPGARSAAFAKERPFVPGSVQIVANEARNRRRSAGRRVHLTLRAATEQPSGGAAPSPEASLLSAETRDALLAAVNELPEDQRTVIALRFSAGLSEREVAEALSLPEGTVSHGPLVRSSG
jgi:RNA polymerase sigma-70 factor (ECF subfamily)